MKYMILLYGSQRDYDAVAGKPAPGEPRWTPADLAPLGSFMEDFNRELAESGELIETRGLIDAARATSLADASFPQTRSRQGVKGVMGLPTRGEAGEIV